ncbi:MAG TPA: TIGR03066 family protein [Gemmataceae bacterium]|jgi:uncharacterized protein (TIGR03066 family)|nr:TIGR03066 family protein [Gemmataceae bacterium]
MKGILAACSVAFVLVAAASADDKEKKFDAAKFVGKWELTKSGDENAPKGAVVEFAKDMKVSITIDLNGKEFKLDGTYKVDGDKITVKLKTPDGKEDEDTDTIKTLTDDMIVLVDKKGKETEFKKKK